MAKTAKNTVKLSSWEKTHLKQLALVEKKIAAAYDELCKKAGVIGALNAGKVSPDKAFSLADYPDIRKQIDNALRELSTNVQVTIVDGVRAQWSLAEDKNDALCEEVLGSPRGKLPEALQKRYFAARNTEAVNSFIKRKEGGLNLSQRVWKYAKEAKVDIESALEIGIKSGQPASAIARDLKRYLQEPKKLFRRVRDEEGVLHLSSRAKEYHPGQGVYRSSYKNALRLAATECNMAYRESDYERWQQLDFVVGIEVKLSNNHTLNGRPFTDICDDLAGRYPKTFKFRGWHPFCRCHAVSILKTNEEIMADNKRILEGKEPLETSVNSVTEMPEGFKQWTADNTNRILAADGRGTLPYFITDNATTVATLADIPLNSVGVKPEPVAFASTAIKRTDELDALAEALGIEKGKPMSFEDANKMRGNPHFAEDEAYRVNCQTCVVANELRRRGLDVEALANTKGSALERLSRHTENAWLDTNGKVPTSVKIPHKEVEYSIDRRGRVRAVGGGIDWARLGEATKEEGRYHIGWIWKGSAKGHIVTFERFADGRFRWYDPQNGKINFFDKAYMAKLSDIKVLRVDNLRINPEMAKNILTRSGAKAKIGGVAADSAIIGRKEIKADIAEYVKARNAAKTYKEKVALDVDMVKNGGFIRSEYHSTAKGSIFATEELPRKIDKSNFELVKNIQMAKKMANNGHDVYMLSNPRSSKSADFIFVKNGKVYYTEGKLSTGKNSLGHNLTKGTSQSERILVDMTGTKDTNYIATRLEEAFKNNSDLKEVMLLKGGRLLSITSRIVGGKNFGQHFKKLWEQKK